MDKLTERTIAREALRRQKLAANSAASILTPRNSSGGAGRFLPLLNNPDPVVREAAIDSLARLGSREVIEIVARRTSDVAPGVRAAACRALGRLRAHSAKAPLYDTLHDRDPAVQCAAAEALAKMGDSAGLTIVARLIRIAGAHQYQALRTVNHITRQSFPINRRGLKDACRYLKAKKRLRY